MKVAKLVSSLIFSAALQSVAWADIDETQPWTGEWQVMWREGTLLMVLEQSSEAVTGHFQPQGGLVSGRVVGDTLDGEWSRDEYLIKFELVMATDQLTFTGRYGKNEYLNGQRIDRAVETIGDFSWSTTPRGTLRAVIVAANRAFYRGDASALELISDVVLFEGGESDLREEVQRRNLLWRLLNMSTFHIFDAPVGSTLTNETTFRIGPAGSEQHYDLRFRLDNGIWKIVIDSEARLAAAERRFLESLGYKSYAQYATERASSPRQSMRDFILGTQDWASGGKEQALATLDLSFIPDQLRTIEGPVLADYLKQIIDRAGFVIWQEIPDDPEQPVPYVHYRHPAGSVVIERKRGGEDEPDRWLFSAKTLQDGPELLDAVQDMPFAEGLTESKPFTRFFQLREWIRERAPLLVQRDAKLENWQWLALIAALLIAGVAARLAGWLAAATLRRLNPKSEQSTDRHTLTHFDWPVRITVAGLVIFYAYASLGIGDGGFTVVGTLAALVVAIGSGFLLYRVVGTIGSYFSARADQTVSYVDEIVTTLATGLVKLLVVVFTIILCADIVGLPYEGVIAGLGIGGLALAFASRETLSNMLGAIMLLADRPFKRGDLIEADGTWANVESVGLRSTRLRTFDDSLLIIPNAQLSDKPIANWGKRRRRKVLLTIGLEYSTPREKLDRFVDGLHKVYEAQPRADTSEFYVGLKEFGASSLDIELWGYFKVYGYQAQVEAQHALIADIVDWAKEVGVSFAFPTRTVHVAQKEETAQVLRSADG